MLETHQNHSLPKLGTENTPQWMKIPNLAWSYHSGSGRESIDFQFGSYLIALPVPQNRTDTTKPTAANISSWIGLWMKNYRRATITWRGKRQVTKVTKKPIQNHFLKIQRGVWYVSLLKAVKFQLSGIRERSCSGQRWVVNLALLPNQRMRRDYLFAEVAQCFVLRVVNTCRATSIVTVISLRGILTRYQDWLHNRVQKTLCWWCFDLTCFRIMPGTDVFYCLWQDIDEVIQNSQKVRRFG